VQQIGIRRPLAGLRAGRWLAYGPATGSLPLMAVDTVGLLCAGLALTVALSLRGSLIRPATWNSRNTTSLSQRPAA
jgi:hypothetical protein